MLTATPSQHPLVKSPLRDRVKITKTQGQVRQIQSKCNQLQTQMQTRQRKKRGGTVKVPVRKTATVRIGGTTPWDEPPTCARPLGSRGLGWAWWLVCRRGGQGLETKTGPGRDPPGCQSAAECIGTGY